MKLLVLSPSLSDYGGARYQLDFIQALGRAVETWIYGPGMSNFDSRDSMAAILDKAPWKPDAIFVGHEWLSHGPREGLSLMPGLDLNYSGVPTYAFLNKEYSYLSEKINWLNDNRVSRVFSHYPDIQQLSGQFHAPVSHVPFAASEMDFFQDNLEKKWDFGFTGILKNPGRGVDQDDVRRQVQQRIFHTIGPVPIVERKGWKGRSLIWRSWTGNRILDKLLELNPERRKIPSQLYPGVLRRTKVWFNSLSPMGLVGTRFYECMASGAVVLTKPHRNLDQLFPRETFVEVNDIHDFERKIFALLDAPEELRKISSRASDLVLHRHTWGHRVASILREIRG